MKRSTKRKTLAGGGVAVSIIAAATIGSLLFGAGGVSVPTLEDFAALQAAHDALVSRVDANDADIAELDQQIADALERLGVAEDAIDALQTPPSSPTVTPPTPTATPTPPPVVCPPTCPGPEPSGPGGGVFSIRCLLDHQAPDDPIVYPGQPGAAHNHGFFGAVGVDAFTTIATLGTAGTSCTLPGDKASYWAPSLIGPDGNVVEPAFMLAYYNANPDVPVRALPYGLKIVAGGTDPDLFGFSCSDQKPYAPIPMSCPSKNVLHVVFPSCWDGVHLDSPDHRSHMAYPVQGGRACPEGFPVRVAKLSIHVQYPGLKNPAGYRFAPNPDGSVPGPHADFFNGWDMAELVRLITLCSNANHDNEGPCKQPTS